MDATTERLVDYTLSARFEDMKPEVIEACKTRILDTLGCIAGAYDHPISVAARRLAGRYSMDTPATILADGAKVSPEMAAFANSVMLRVLDMSDTYRVKSGGHPSDLMGAAFAAAEIGADAKSGGKSLITAIALGYEVYCGFTEAIEINTQGWDQPVYGVVASALSAGKLLGLDRDQLANTVALALVPNMAMFQTREGELSAWKGCAGANAARNGLFAALLAQAGFTGPEKPVEGKHGLWDTIGQFDWPLEPGEPPYRIAKTHLKSFPICYHGQTAVWTALGLRDRFAVADAEAIRVDTYHKAFNMMGSNPTRWAPKTRETADHSLPYVVGTAFLQGAVDEAAFSDEALQAQAVTSLMGRISVVEDDGLTALHPECSPCRITVTLKDGSEIQNELRYPKGHAGNPMTEDEVRDKFRSLFTGYGDSHHADDVIAAVDGLEGMADIAPLIDSFRIRTP
ncbi:MAG: MmgE/PrpD family protein [Proteobacteria bacterium]|nr:MmgE/PrpD family protein [Pseudomonadota bacterium]